MNGMCAQSLLWLLRRLLIRAYSRTLLINGSYGMASAISVERWQLAAPLPLYYRTLYFMFLARVSGCNDCHWPTITARCFYWLACVETWSLQGTCCYLFFSVALYKSVCFLHVSVRHACCSFFELRFGILNRRSFNNNFADDSIWHVAYLNKVCEQGYFFVCLRSTCQQTFSLSLFIATRVHLIAEWLNVSLLWSAE